MSQVGLGVLHSLGPGGPSYAMYWGKGGGLTCEPEDVRNPGVQTVSECGQGEGLENKICS